jgi:ubiquinone/menaquinone biosynthesis C-methylase UbiE
MDKKTEITNTFNLVAEGYDRPALRFFPLAGEHMANQLKLKPGERVLDIATGTGAFAIAAGQRVRPGGRVQAIDLSTGMLAVAEAKVQRLGLDNIDFHNMDAGNLEFRSDHFDAIGCSFGLFFLEDMAASLSAWKRLLKPGGRLMFTSFSPSAFQPMTDLFFDDLQGTGVEVPPPGARGAPARLPSVETCLSLLTDAGYNNVVCHTKQLGYRLTATQDWWELLRNAGFRGYLEQIDPERLPAFRDAHLQNVEALRQSDGIWMDVETWFCGGTRPLDAR